MRLLQYICPCTVAALSLLPSLVLSQDYTCSPTKECAIGCCGQYGICGMGLEFCGLGNCTASCDAKSECDPGGWGPPFASSETCTLNVCCSPCGFCGTTEEFCGSAVVTNPSCSGTSSTQRTIAYYEGWSVGRPWDVMYPENIPAADYTHINFTFASIDPVTFQVAPMSVGDTDLYARLTNLKTLNPSLQV
jgi:hypothetical protein